MSVIKGMQMCGKSFIFAVNAIDSLYRRERHVILIESSRPPPILYSGGMCNIVTDIYLLLYSILCTDIANDFFHIAIFVRKYLTFLLPFF
jgi:hypothetical protein